MVEIYYITVVLAIFLSTIVVILDYQAGMDIDLLPTVILLAACITPGFNIVIIATAFVYILAGE